MLQGEQKRRGIALRWVDEVTSILSDVGADIWGMGTSVYGEYTEAIYIGNNGIYFRYKTHYGKYPLQEDMGFYFQEQGYSLIWGKEIEEMRGKHFWWAIRCILEWLPEVLKLMEEKEISREALLKKLA